MLDYILILFGSQSNTTNTVSGLRANIVLNILGFLVCLLTHFYTQYNMCLATHFYTKYNMLYVRHFYKKYRMLFASQFYTVCFVNSMRNYIPT